MAALKFLEKISEDNLGPDREVRSIKQEAFKFGERKVATVVTLECGHIYPVGIQVGLSLKSRYNCSQCRSNSNHGI